MKQQNDQRTKELMTGVREIDGGGSNPRSTKTGDFTGLAGVNGCIRRGETIGLVAVQLAGRTGV
jgi:hypothetical protein